MDVGPDVVHGHQGLFQPCGKALGIAGAHQQAADEAWPRGNRDQVEVLRRELGVLERFFHQWVEADEVLPRGDFGDNAAEFAVDPLAGHLGIEDLIRTIEHRDAGIVAARFYAED